MAGITEKVQNDMVAAMKARDRERLAALRMLVSELRMGAKEAGEPFTEQQETAVLRKEKKRRLQAAEAFRAGGREDRALKEEAEAGLIETYLPQEMGEEELRALVDAAITETGAAGPKDTGRVMSAVMAKAGGRADGKTVSGMVRERLQ